MINKIKTNNNLMTTKIIKRINYRKNKIYIKIFKIRRDNKVQKNAQKIFSFASRFNFEKLRGEIQQDIHGSN
jgi:hypothetical protein